MAKILSISSDRNIFNENSPARARQIEYGNLFDELHIVVFASIFSGYPAKIQIAPNVWVYSTHSITKFTHIARAVGVGGKIIADNNFQPGNSVVTVQDPFETGLVGSKLRRRFKLPFHVQVHTDFLSPYFKKESLMNRFRVKMALKILPQADAIRVVGKRIAEGLKKINLKPDVEPKVLPVFVDINKIADAQPVYDLRTKYPQFNFIMLMASRLTREKNIPLAIKTFASLAGVYPKIGLVIVGSGPEKGSLKSLAHKLGVGNSVVFEDWQIDLVSYYKTANIFLVTSNYEGYGMTIVEALAAHCPVVSTDVGIASDVLKDGDSFVCPVGSMECLFNKISQFVENISVRTSFTNEAFYRLENVVLKNKEEYLSLYKENIESALYRWIGITHF